MSSAPFLYKGSHTVARQGNKLIARATFLAEIAELAEQLPDRPYVVNFCDDRYRFSVTWAAAMLRGQVTLLPSRRDAGAVATLRADYPALYVVVDDATDDLPAPLVSYPKLAGGGGETRVPAFPPDQIAAVLFTSGSTGCPNPSPRSWGRLVASTLAAGEALGVQQHCGAALVATVPHAHSYGLESAIMLPLQHGLLLTAGRPFFPSDVAAALAGDRPAILVTTPVHLRALVGHTAMAEPGSSFGAPVQTGFVLSATAPLPAELAARAEAVFNAHVFEIYGCSEAGQIATRRTVDGPVWRCVEGFRLRQNDAGTWASGPNEDDVLLADEIELSDDRSFILQGRTADIVNVAGKRSSLAYLARQLMTIDGVQDGVFLRPDDAADGAPTRLAAVVVAPARSAATILAALRERIDPAFLPRPLRVVETLPRNALGKLPRSEILCLLGSTRASLAGSIPAPGGSMPTTPVDPVVPGSLLLHFPADHPAGPGHFPGSPIISGAMLLDHLVAALFPGSWSGEITATKFHRLIRPGNNVIVTHRSEDSTTHFECREAESDQLVVSGVLRSTSPSR